MHDRSEGNLSAQGAARPVGAEVEITLVVPVYDEEENIVSFVEEVKATLDIPYQIVVVFDRDEDTTLRKRGAVQAIDPTVAFVKNTGGTGVINAFRTGFNVAQTRYVVPIMADLSDTPSTIADMHRKRAGPGNLHRTISGVSA